MGGNERDIFVLAAIQSAYYMCLGLELLGSCHLPENSTLIGLTHYRAPAIYLILTEDILFTQPNVFIIS